MFRAASLVLILAVLLCACQFNNNSKAQETVTPETTSTPKPDIKWEDVDEFLVLSTNNSAYRDITNIYDIKGNLLKTIYAISENGYYTKDNILAFRFNKGAYNKIFSFKTGDFMADGADFGLIEEDGENYYLFWEDDSLNIYFKDGEFLENVPYEQAISMVDNYYKEEETSEDDADAIIQKLGLNENDSVDEFNDYFAVVNLREGSTYAHKLYSFYLNDFVDLNIPSGNYFSYISISDNTNYAIISFEKASDDDSDSIYFIIDMFGITRYTDNYGHVAHITKDLIYLRRGNYHGFADLDGNWIVKVMSEYDI